MKAILMSFILFIQGCMLFQINIHAEEKEAEPLQPVLIATYHADLTGDKRDDTIYLKGTLFSSDSAYYKEIWVDIEGSNDQKWRIDYAGGGYDPELQFIDLNHDGVKDILYQSPTGGSGGLYTYQLNTLVGNTITEIPLPEQQHVMGAFIDDFKVEIIISTDLDPIILDVKDRAQDYIILGIYSKDGKVKQSTSLMIDPIAFFEPVFLNESKGYALKSYQQVSGAYHADGLGTVESLWYYKDGQWIILQTKWVGSNPEESAS